MNIRKKQELLKLIKQYKDSKSLTGKIEITIDVYDKQGNDYFKTSGVDYITNFNFINGKYTLQNYKNDAKNIVNNANINHLDNKQTKSLIKKIEKLLKEKSVVHHKDDTLWVFIYKRIPKEDLK